MPPSIAPTEGRHVQARRSRADLVAFVRNLARDERGQDLIEYGLLCGFITLGVVLAATNVGTTVNGIYGGVSTQVAAIPAP